MKPHRILKTFKGSQTGHDHHHFEAGTVAPLSDSLAAVVVKAGWAEPHEDTPTKPSVSVPLMARMKTEEDGSGMPNPDEIEEKSEDAAPENKMKKAAPENKKAKK